MKCKTREQAIQRYGSIDLEHRLWVGEDRWIKPLAVPEGWFPGWHVLDTDHIVKFIACNVDTHEPMLAALRMVRDKGLGGVLKTFDGCFNIRAVRGSGSLSTHAYGLGFDFNAAGNPLGSTRGDFAAHMDFVNCFVAQGFDWGGAFTGRKDPMHFSYAWEGHS